MNEYDADWGLGSVTARNRAGMLGAVSKIILSVLSMQGNISNLFVVLRAGEKLIISLPSFDQHEEDKVDI